MSGYFDYLEAHGGIDPYTEQADDDRSPCGCGHPDCRIDGNDASNVLVNGKWFNPDCLGLCILCQQVDDLNNLDRIAGFWLAHPKCSQHDDRYVAGMEYESRLDQRDGK